MKIEVTGNGYEIDEDNVKSISISSEKVGEIEKRELFIMMKDEHQAIDPRRLHKDST